MLEARFWMLYAEGTNALKGVHATFGEAAAEAKRLTAATGNVVYLLEAIGKYTHSPTLVVEIPPEPRP